MTESQPRRGSRVPLAFGLIFVVSGLWLLLNAQGVSLPSFAKYWPILPLLAGVAALVDLFFLGKRPGSAGWAVTDVGCGVLGFAVTLGYTSLGKILDWLPSLPTILGLSLFATWLAGGRRNESQVIAGAVLVVLGLLGFAARFEWLQRLLPSAQVLWALLLVVGGGVLVWRAFARGKS